MFIEWANQLSLLEHDPETHILKDFSLPVQKILVQEVVTFLLAGNATRTLKSASHVRWAMETCGQGFLLPIEEEDSISKVISLYRSWALEPKERPAPFDQNPQYFLQKILQQSSLLFEARATPKDLSARHAALCSEVLDIYSHIGRNLGSELSVETWEIFLKILIAVSDSILRIDAPASIEPLQKALCSQLQKVVFELWLLSGTKNPSLWEAFQNRVRGWTRHMPLTLAWKVVCFSLTKRTVNILYGINTSTEAVIIKFDDSVQTLYLDEQYVFYAWHRMLNIIGNPTETVNQPQILLAFMNAVELIVNQFLKVDFTPLEDSLIAPTGNTILHIFGAWLFDCILSNRSGFEEGTALAMKILNNIMITKHKTNFLPVYVSSYFSSLQRALSTEGRLLVSAIISTSDIFIKEIKGIRCLVPVFFTAIQKVLSGRIKSVENVMPVEHLRKACLNLFGTLICLPNHFHSTPFNAQSLTNLEVSDYSSLKPHYSTLLTESLTKETNLSNIELLLNLSYIWVVEDIEENCDFARQIIGLLIRKISQKKWDADVIIPALHTLGSLAKVYPLIAKGFEQANLVVDQLCRVIVSIGNPPSPTMEPIAVLAFDCITRWIMADQWLFDYTETRASLLRAIVSSITGKQSQSLSEPEPVVAAPSGKKKDKKSKKEDKSGSTPKGDPKKQQIAPPVSILIQEAANETLLVLLNHAGNFPTPSGASVISSLALEEEILSEIVASSQGTINTSESKEFMRYYITDDKTIIAAIDRPYHPSGPCCCIIIRDKTGRYAWDTSLTYSKISEAKQETIYHEKDITITACPYEPYTIKPLDVNELHSVLGYLNEASTGSAFKTVEVQVQKEYKVLKRNNFGLNSDISIAIPCAKDSYSSDCKFQQSRMFLSHAGYLSLENRGKLYPLSMSANFFQALRQLDGKAERNCIDVGVIFGQRGQTEDEWFGNEGGSEDYQEFISTLGWGISMEDHNGYKGEEDCRLSDVAPYWADFNTELLFQVTTLGKNDTSLPDHAHKRRAALSSSVLVIWLEDFANFQAQSIWKHVRYNLIIIVIVPQQYGLYFVRIFSKDDLALLGPIIDRCVLSKPVLGRLVRDTCYFAWKKVHGDSPSPSQIRSECIDRIYSSFKRIETLEQFYTSQFTTMDGLQVSPLDVPHPAPSPSARVMSSSPKKTLTRSSTSGVQAVKTSTPLRASQPVVNRAVSQNIMPVSGTPPSPVRGGRGRGLGRGRGGAPRPATPTPVGNSDVIAPVKVSPPKGRGRGLGMGRGGTPRPAAPTPVEGPSEPAPRPVRPPPPRGKAPARPQTEGGGSWLGTQRATPTRPTGGRPAPSFGTQRRSSGQTD